MKKVLLAIIMAFATLYTLSLVSLAETENGIVYNISGGKAYITGYEGDAVELIIPDTLGNCPVTRIDAEAFYNCGSIESIVIPNSVENIGLDAFYNCRNLQDITIGNGIKVIGKDAFKYTGWVNNDSNWDNYCCYIGDYLVAANKELSGKVDIRAGTKVIGSGVFTDCKGLESVFIPKSVIGFVEAFSHSDLKSVTIEEGVADIGAMAFSYCTELENVTIPGSVKTIGGSAFLSCWKLKNVTIEKGVENIDEGAFSRCTTLESIVLPSSIKSIAKDVFSSCQKFKDVYYGGSEEEWKSIRIANGVFGSAVVIHFADSEVLIGDVNGDNSADMKDVLILRKYLANVEVSVFNRTCADVNEDETVDMKDVLLIRKILAYGNFLSEKNAVDFNKEESILISEPKDDIENVPQFAILKSVKDVKEYFEKIEGVSPKNNYEEAFFSSRIIVAMRLYDGRIDKTNLVPNIYRNENNTELFIHIRNNFATIPWNAQDILLVSLPVSEFDTIKSAYIIEENPILKTNTLEETEIDHYSYGLTKVFSF